MGCGLDQIRDLDLSETSTNLWEQYAESPDYTTPRLSVLEVRSSVFPPVSTPLHCLWQWYLVQEAENLAWMTGLQPMQFEEWVLRYPRGPAAILKTARQEYETMGINPNKVNLIKNFIKVETTVRNTDPRNISPPDPGLMVLLGPVIAAMDKAAHYCPYMVKGLNPAERDQKLSRLLEFDAFADIDFDRLDKSIDENLQRVVEVGHMKHAYSEHVDCDLFVKWLEYCFTSSGVNDLGVKYVIHGQRRSGDNHTSTFNAGVCRFAVWMCFRHIPAEDWWTYHEGDDILIGYRSEWRDQLEVNLSYISLLGLSIKLTFVNSFEQLSFCGRYLYEDAGVVCSYADPYRTLAKIHTSVTPGDTMILMLAKAFSYAHTDAFTPIIGVFAQVVRNRLLTEVNPARLRRVLMKNLRKAEMRYNLIAHFEDNSTIFINALLSSSAPVVRASPAGRAAFAGRTGITIRQQCDFEDEYLGWLEHGIPALYTKLDVDFEFRELVWHTGRGHELYL